MVVLAGLLFAAAAVSLLFGFSMEVTRGDVYNTGLLAQRSVLVSVGSACLVSGSVVAAAASLASALTRSSALGATSGAPAVPAAEPVPLTADEEEVATRVRRQLAAGDHQVAANPRKLASVIHQTAASELIGALAASRGYQVVEYLPGGGVQVARGLGHSRQFWSLRDAEAALDAAAGGPVA